MQSPYPMAFALSRLARCFRDQGTETRVSSRRHGRQHREHFSSIVFLSVATTAFGEPTDAISREFTVYNDLSGNLFNGAVSREFTVFNGLGNLPPTDSLSREFTVFKGESGSVPTFVDAVSREFTAFNDLSVGLKDAVAREFSVHNAFHCSGNLTGDGLVTSADIQGFVQVLLGRFTDPQLIDAADVNCDGLVNGLDIQRFVACLNSGSCP